MRTEHILSDEQKKQIYELNQKIFDLQMQISNIYAMSPVRYITETDEEAENIRKFLSLGQKPLQGIVKINTSEV